MSQFSPKSVQSSWKDANARAAQQLATVASRVFVPECGLLRSTASSGHVMMAFRALCRAATEAFDKDRSPR